MTTIIYTCPYVPAEWITAHGMRPSRIIPDKANLTGPLSRAEGVCPFVQAFANKVMMDEHTECVLITTVCDQMRRVYDFLVRRCDVPLFLMNVPNTWQNVDVQKLYIDELKRLGRFLIGLGGKSPSEDALAKIMLEYDTARKSVLAAGGHLPARQYAEKIAALGRDGPGEALNNTSNTRISELQIKGVPLAIIGGPLMKQDFEIFDIVEQAGGRIMLDATETGERGLCAPFNRRSLNEEPLLELASVYFCTIQDASRRPNSELYQWLISRLEDREVRGIIFHHNLWCDMWHAEFQRLKDWTSIPVLDIDTVGDNETTNQRMTNRIRAFLETLQ